MLKFADDNNISAAERTIEDLISVLDRFKLSKMVVNTDKFQGIVVKKNA